MKSLPSYLPSMKTLIHAISFLLFLSVSTRAFALAGELKEPDIALPVGFSESTRTNVMAALRHPACNFSGGYFLNSFTSLKYEGNTSALNLFLDSFSKCSGVTLSIRFNHEHATESDWLVAHNAQDPGRFTVHVNVQSKNIKVADLVIPDICCPATPSGSE